MSKACGKMEEWRRYHNEERPHSTIGNIPPATRANSHGNFSL
ncbi:integrase core domain-containing protein [Shimia thalassica]